MDAEECVIRREFELMWKPISDGRNPEEIKSGRWFDATRKKLELLDLLGVLFFTAENREIGLDEDERGRNV